MAQQIDKVFECLNPRCRASIYLQRKTDEEMYQERNNPRASKWIKLNLDGTVHKCKSSSNDSSSMSKETTTATTATEQQRQPAATATTTTTATPTTTTTASPAATLSNDHVIASLAEMVSIQDRRIAELTGTVKELQSGIITLTAEIQELRKQSSRSSNNNNGNNNGGHNKRK